ncbi:DUF833-domain-containing protein [Myriangium duriaei CBS 260.36]|uniref:DUF833-domain-containing protein n=1 Tax=Myriangium duriaei CBS 260.36 TaxID=1168546 RepID=A0A9P4MC48_9PEZI|nr:DUF833-domain-containing protein [Myriangium duriaei CBS 260.36]
MCIALLSTSHPSYALVLASNRDEFISRPTAPATWWNPSHPHVLGGRDLQRSVRGTWLGITRQGRLACLTNLRESSTSAAPVSGLQSRGAIALSYLTVPADSRETPAEAAERIVGTTGVQDVGGFSLLFGQVRRPGSEGRREPLGVLSNRTPDARGVVWIAEGEGEVHGLSNAHFGDGSWPKVASGEQLLREVLEDNVRTRGPKGELVERLFELLSIDTLPKREAGQEWDSVVLQLRKSIFIPRLSQNGADVKADEIAAARSKEAVSSSDGAGEVDGVYATHQQTVILVDMQGHVTFVEKTLYTGKEHGGDSVRTFEFDIEGW